MALKNVERVTLSLPKITIRKLEISIPKSKRSKYIADLIERDLKNRKSVSIEEIDSFWGNLAKQYRPEQKKSAVELQREERSSH